MAEIEKLWLRWQGPMGLVWRHSEHMIETDVAVLPNVRAVRAAAIRFFAGDAPTGQKAQNQHGDKSGRWDAVGDELFTPGRVETNSHFLTDRLGEAGVPVGFRAVVGDDEEALAEELPRKEMLAAMGDVLDAHENDLDSLRDMHAALKALKSLLEMEATVAETERTGARGAA